MQLHSVKRNSKRKKSVQVGRGGKRGKTSGRGTKGQKARAGHKIRPEIRDMIKKLPKMRGRGKNSNKSIKAPFTVVSLTKVSTVFDEGSVISPVTLSEKGLINKNLGKLPKVKILGGEISKKMTFENCAYSSSAKEKIEKAGGSIKEAKVSE